jgi:hypothetical protein
VRTTIRTTGNDNPKAKAKANGQVVMTEEQGSIPRHSGVTSIKLLATLRTGASTTLTGPEGRLYENGVTITKRTAILLRLAAREMDLLYRNYHHMVKENNPITTKAEKGIMVTGNGRARIFLPRTTQNKHIPLYMKSPPQRNLLIGGRPTKLDLC